MHKASRKSEQ